MYGNNLFQLWFWHLSARLAGKESVAAVGPGQLCLAPAAPPADLLHGAAHPGQQLVLTLPPHHRRPAAAPHQTGLAAQSHQLALTIASDQIELTVSFDKLILAVGFDKLVLTVSSY